MRIRTRLLFLVLSILIPAFLTATVAVWFVYTEENEAQSKGVSEAARTLAQLADKELRTHEAVLRALAASPMLANDDLAAFYRYARSLAPPSHSTIILTDTSGRQLINTLLPYGAALPKGNSNLMDVRRLAAPDALVVSDLYVGPVRKRYDFAVQVPVLRGGEVRYYLSTGIAAERLRPLLGADLPSTWRVSLIDRNGIVVARSQDAGKYVGQPVRDMLRTKILRGDRAGIHYGTTLDGIETAGFFHRAAASGWTVIVNIPSAEMRRPAVYGAAFLGSIMVVLLLAAVAAAHRYAHRTAGPIEQLRHAARSMGRGEPVRMPLTGLVETDSVGAALTEASAKIRQNKAELERRVAEAVASSERAQRALLKGQQLEALGRLTAGIGHDFNNILQTLSTALQLIRMTKDHERISALAATCEKAITRATVLTGQMRAFGQVQDARLETVDLRPAVEAAFPLLQSAVPGSIALSLDAGEALWPVTVDTLQLELALLNLVINARDAMPDGGQVDLALHNTVLSEPLEELAPGDYVELSVRDNGSGMPPEVLAKALDPFFTTKAVDKGSGLGLPQAYGFARQSNGTLLVNSVEGTGTAVTIYLPRAAAASASAPAPPVTAQSQGGAATLLFVEDDKLVREAVAPALAGAGFDVVTAESGDEARALLESGQRFDVVFSDIVMPGATDGLALARLVRQRFPQVRIVLATGHSEMRVNLPGVKVLAKPYDIQAAVSVLTEAA